MGVEEVLAKYVEFHCPEARSVMGRVDLCNLNDRICLLDAGDYCEHFEQFLTELEQDE